MTRFAYDSSIVARYPSVAGGIVHATALSNGPSSPALLDAYRHEQAAVRARIGDAPLSELPSIAAWRRAFRAFGVDPTAYRSAAEALLRRLTKQGSIPTINTLVDIGNLVSIRHALPVAVLDQRAVTGGTLVRFADGTETFRDLATGEPETPATGEVIFIDDAGLVSARRWCWRQSAESAAGTATTEVLVAIEAHHDAGRDAVAAAAADFAGLLRAHCPAGTVTTAVIDAATPAFEA